MSYTYLLHYSSIFLPTVFPIRNHLTPFNGLMFEPPTFVKRGYMLLLQPRTLTASTGDEARVRKIHASQPLLGWRKFYRQSKLQNPDKNKSSATISPTFFLLPKWPFCPDLEQPQKLMAAKQWKQIKGRCFDLCGVIFRLTSNKQQPPKLKSEIYICSGGTNDCRNLCVFIF